MAEWVVRSEGEAVWVRCPAQLIARQTSAAVRDFLQVCREQPGPFGVVIDLRGLREYDGESRSLWQAALREQRPNITNIVFISSNPIFRMVGAGVGLYTGTPTQCVLDPEAAALAVSRPSSRRRAAEG